MEGTHAKLEGMEPLPGMTVVGEFNTRFDADLAVAMLQDSGLEGAVFADPAHHVAPHLMTDRTFRVVVRCEVADDAREILTEAIEADSEVKELDAAYFHRPFSQRPGWIRLAGWSVFWALPGTFLVCIALFLFLLVSGLFP